MPMLTMAIVMVKPLIAPLPGVEALAMGVVEALLLGVRAGPKEREAWA